MLPVCLRGKKLFDAVTKIDSIDRHDKNKKNEFIPDDEGSKAHKKTHKNMNKDLED